VRIVGLQARPAWLPALARAHVQAFGTLLPAWTVEQAEAELRMQRDDTIPCTWVAEDDAGWLGSVSLLHDDHEQIRGWPRCMCGPMRGAAALAHGWSGTAWRRPRSWACRACIFTARRRWCRGTTHWAGHRIPGCSSGHWRSP